MPIYEYKCDECNHQFEKIQKFSDKPLDQCPECEYFTLHRVPSYTSSFRIGGLGVHKPTTHWGDPG